MVLLLLLLLAFPELYFYNSYYIYLGRQEYILFSFCFFLCFYFSGILFTPLIYTCIFKILCFPI